MFRAKDLETFPQLDSLMGNDEIVTQVNGRYKDFKNSQLYAVWKSAREKLKSNGLSCSYTGPEATVPDIVSAIEIACTRKQFNIRRDELLEKIVKRELERIDDETIYNCAKECVPEEAEKFKRIRDLYGGLRRFRQKFWSRRGEYRWDYESTKIEYRKSRRYLLSNICNYILHPKKSDGEFGVSLNDKEIKIIRKKNRSRILRIKEKMLRTIRKNLPLYKNVVDCEDNLRYQNIHQQMEKEDLTLIRNVLLRVCPHDDHDFLECPNLKEIKVVLGHAFSAYSE